MSPFIIGVIGIAVIFALLSIGVPIAVVLAVVGFAGLWYFVGPTAALVTAAVSPIEWVSSYMLAVLPLFVLMANVCAVTGLSTELFNLARKWLGSYRGGIAMATTGAAAGFAAVSASSLATATTIGRVAIPEMRRLGYDTGLAAGTIAAGGTIGILIPPSGTLIIYGILTETSIGRLFLGGVVPGILEALFYMVTIYILCSWKPSLGPRGPSFSLRDKLLAIGPCGEMIALVAFVLGGLMGGLFTPTEAGAVGAFGAILFSLIRGRLNWQKFREAILETMKTTGLIFAILVGANLFSQFLALSTLPFQLTKIIAGMQLSPVGIMAAMIGIYIVLGCFLNSMAMIMLTIPVFFPLAVSLGFNPIWFGIILVRVVEIGLITPPIGMNVYVIAGLVPDVPMQRIFKSVIPFIIADICHVGLLLLVPAVVLFLPNLMMG